MAFVVVLLVFAAWTYWMYVGRPSTRSGVLAVLIGVFAALAAYDGTVLAIREYGRAHHGRVKAGTVVAKLSSTGADGSQSIRSPRRRRYRPILTTEGFKVHDLLARLILTGSTNAWIIEYRYGCERPYGCRGRDFVQEDLWRRLNAGATVNVRQSNEETSSSRLDENPQWEVAMLDVTIGGALLLLAGGVSGRLTAHRSGRLRSS